MKNFSHQVDSLQQELEELVFDREPQQLYAPARYMLQLGGKRIRPALLLMACEAMGGRAQDALPPAIGIEIFHNFTLVHDDIMDNASLRRGHPTVHQHWDQATAILSGDAMQVLAFQYVMRAPEAARPAIFDLFSETCLQVCEGQMMDMHFEERGDVEVWEYLEMIRLKTSALLACALGIGGLVGGADDYAFHRLYDLGTNLGIAFQLQDDLLDTFGDEQQLGKRIGNDILARKKTYLMLKLRHIATPEQWAEIERLYANPQDEEGLIGGVRDLYEELGVRENTERLLREYFNQAQECLDALPIDTQRKRPLWELATFLFQRSY
jgi:geranylgeranyl diphosphate synthase type II